MAGGGGQNTTSTVTQSNLPAYAQPYYESLMDRGLSESQRPYQTYDGQRLAGESDATAQGLGMSQDFAGSSTAGYQNATDVSGLAALGGLNYANYQSAPITNGYNGPVEGNYQGSDIQSQQIGFNGQTAGNVSSVNSATFDQNAANQYMSPYVQDVVDNTKQHALTSYQQQRAANNANVATTGAFGGSRGAVQDMVAQNQLMTGLNDIQTQGMQDAYTNAQSQFNADQGRSMQAQLANQQAGLGAAQSNQQSALDAAKTNEASRQYGYGATESAYQKAADDQMAAQQATEQFRQSGADLGLKGLDVANQSAAQMTSSQQALDNGALNRIKAQLGVGQTQEDYQQQSLDQSYNDFVNQRDSERQNLQFLSSLLQGVPISANKDVTSSTPTNPLAGAVGSISGLQALYGLGQQTG